jgi:hypothetical protein
MGKQNESTKYWNAFCGITAISSRIICLRCNQWERMPKITPLSLLEEYHYSLQTLGSILERIDPSKQKKRIRHVGTIFTG